MIAELLGNGVAAEGIRIALLGAHLLGVETFREMVLSYDGKQPPAMACTRCSQVRDSKKREW